MSHLIRTSSLIILTGLLFSACSTIPEQLKGGYGSLMPENTTEKDLEKYLFGQERVAEVVLGYEWEKPVGFALFFHNFSTFLGKPGIYLEDLFVIKEYRGKGYGKTLLTYLAKLAMERECGRLEWAVLDWNEPSIEFYKSLGATLLNDWIVNRVSGESLVKLAEMH